MSSLYIDRKGTSLTLSGDALICYENGERIGTIPLAPIERIYLKGDVTLQTSLLAKLGEKNIGIVCLSGRKNTPTLFMPQPHNDAERRLAQYELANNEAFCLCLAQNITLLKLQLQARWLKLAAEQRPDKKAQLNMQAAELALFIHKIRQQPDLPALRGIEGKAASVYFAALSHYLPASLDFDGRNRRPPRDPFNAVMSLAYTLVHCEAVLAAHGAGLDPYIGFYHALDYGRESLACDLIEPLRPLIDNWLLGCFRDEILRIEHFSTTAEGCFLGKAGRIHFYQAYEQVAAQWRKMLTESCYDLVRILKSCRANPSPQRRSHQFNDATTPDWQPLVEHYYFNQQTLLGDWPFRF